MSLERSERRMEEGRRTEWLKRGPSHGGKIRKVSDTNIRYMKKIKDKEHERK